MFQIPNDFPFSSKFPITSPEYKHKFPNESTYQFNTQSPDINKNKQEYSPFVIKNGTYSSSPSKSLSFLSEKKPTRKMYTPFTNSSKKDKLSDRFIPMNRGINLMEKFKLANKYEELDENRNNSNMDSNLANSKMVYDEILKQYALNENSNTNIFTQKCLNNSFNNHNNLKTKIFSYKTENKPKDNFYYSIFNNQKDKDNNLSCEIQRKINPKPYKILKAPNLMDDFYLNLVDWSSKNDIAVGLRNSVGLWCTNQTQETTLFSYPNTLSNVNIGEKYVSSVMWSQSGDTLAIGNSRGEVEIYDGILYINNFLIVNKLEKIIHFEDHKARIGAVSWNENIISSGSKDCCIISRDIRSNNSVISTFIGHNQEICGLKWSFDGTQLASGGNDNKLMIWSLHSQSPIMCNTSHTAAVKAIAWSPHQHNMLVSGGGTADRTIRFWNTTLCSQLKKIDTSSQVCNLVFSKTVNELVSTHGFSLNQIILWKLPTLNKIATLTGHTYRVLYLGLSPDGQNIVTGAGDETLRFWNLFPPFKMDSMSSLFPSNKDIR